MGGAEGALGSSLSSLNGAAEKGDPSARPAYHLPMPDWERFRAAVVAGSQPYELCRACELAWSCLELTPEEFRERIRDNIHGDAEATCLQNALCLVRTRLLRDEGIDPTDAARW